MKKLLLFFIIGLSTYACKYDYDCYCIQSGNGVGSKSLKRATRSQAQSECNAFQAELAADTTNTDSTAITCDLVQTY